jgi:hypothetical protein
MLTRRNRRGQALVEFALVLPIFVLALFGVIDGARLIYTSNQLSQAAREGARVASVEARWIGSADPACVTSTSTSPNPPIPASRPGAHVCPADASALKADVVAAVNQMAVGLGTITMVYLSCDTVTSGDPEASPPIPADAPPTGAWTEASVEFPECAPDTNGIAPPTASGDLVSVRVEYQYTPITPIVGSIIGSPTLSGSATMVIN